MMDRIASSLLSAVALVLLLSTIAIWAAILKGPGGPLGYD